MNARKGLRLGLLASCLLFLAILAIPLTICITSYDGHCVSFEPPKRPCTFLEYLGTAFILNLVYLAFGRPVLYVFLVAGMLALPLVGHIVDKRKHARQLFYEGRENRAA